MEDYFKYLHKMRKEKTVTKKVPAAKQMNVMVPLDVQINSKYKEKTRFMSFSQYVNSLIAKDLNI